MHFLIDDVFLLPSDLSGRAKMEERINKKHCHVPVTLISRSILSRPIECFYVGSGKKYIAVFASHHALESITANIAYIFIDYLLSKMHGEKILGIDCKLLLSKYCFAIVPCVNPDGVELRYHGAEHTPLYERQMRMSAGDFTTWQSNARGVDLNHNYDFGFSEYKEVERDMGIVPGPTLFSGEYPESEPEVRGVANLVRVLGPAAVISLHSQGEEIYSFPNSKRIARITKKLSDMTGYLPTVPKGTATFGGLCDYTASLGIPSFTVELGKGKNPLPEGEIPGIFSRVSEALAILPTLL